LSRADKVVLTNGWKWPLFMISYLFVLAYCAAGLTYWTAVAPVICL